MIHYRSTCNSATTETENVPLALFNIAHLNHLLVKSGETERASKRLLALAHTLAVIRMIPEVIFKGFPVFVNTHSYLATFIVRVHEFVQVVGKFVAISTTWTSDDRDLPWFNW
jgi:hypothetical protein